MSQWPEGLYGLLMPIFGCPSNDAFDWLMGMVTVTSGNDDVMTGNLTSDLLHIRGPFDSHVTLSLCLRDPDYAGSARMWPRGSYCIFQYKMTCPIGDQIEAFYLTLILVSLRRGLLFHSKIKSLKQFLPRFL